MLGVMAASSKRTYASTPHTYVGLLLPVPLTPQQATVDPHLCQKLPNICKSNSVSCGVTAPFFLVLVHTKLCLCQETASPVLWEICNQIPLTFNSQIPWVFPVPLWDPQVGKSEGGLELLLQCVNFFGIIVL